MFSYRVHNLWYEILRKSLKLNSCSGCQITNVYAEQHEIPGQRIQEL